MNRVPESATFLFTSAAECERYRIAARTSKTDIRVIIAAEKLRIVRREECRLLSHRQLNLLMDVIVRGARDQKPSRAIREEWLLTLLEDHGSKGGALGHYLRIETTPPASWHREKISEDDFFAKARRLWGHFEARR